MEYEEEIDDPGSKPSFGAIFMSNIETKRECLRRKILALPFSKANFVKKVKEGMVLFLFEFERRQLFGVYRAVTDGGMNISRSSFQFSGRHFPAQVRFTTIWECTPLCEPDFLEAIRENYYTPKKFHFGLSQVQVSHLLQLFDSRKLPPKQLGIDTRFTRSVVNDKKWADQRRISIRERLKTRDCKDDSPQMEMSEFSLSSPHKAIEANDYMLFVDERVKTGKDVNFIRELYSNGQVDDSLFQRKRAYNNDTDTEFYDPDAPGLSYRTDDLDVSLGKERVLTTCGFSPIADISENGFNIYAGFPPDVDTKYSQASLDVNRIVYERTELESTNDELFEGSDTMKSRLNSRGAFGCAISDELDDVHKRAGRVIRSGQNCNMDDDDVNPMVPSKICDDFQPFVNRTYGKSKYMMDSGMGTQHNLDTGLGFNLLSEKMQTSLDIISRRVTDERRFTSGSKAMNANGIGGIHRSTISYKPAEYSVSHNRKDGGNFISLVRKEDFPSSLDRFSMSYLDNGSFQLNGSQNMQTSNPAYHDSVATRTSAPECPTTHMHSSSTGVNQGAASDRRSYYSGGDFLNSSNRKSREVGLCGRFDTSACGENKDLHPARRDLDHPYAASQCPELRPSDIRLQFTSPSTHCSAPFTDYEDVCPKKGFPLSSLNRTFPHGMESDICWQEIDQRNSGEEVLPSITNLAGFGYHGENYFTSEGLGHSQFPSKRTYNDDGQHLNPGDAYPDSQRQRISVFSRMGETPKAQTKEENERHDTYLYSSVDEIKDMLNSHQNVRSRDHRKSKPVDRQLAWDEMVRTDVQPSLEPVKRFLATPMEDATSLVTTPMEDATSLVIAEGVNEFPEETRVAEFKRRRDLKNMSAANTPKTTVLENTSIENDASEGLVHKQQKRRKLLRPNFGSDASVDAVGTNPLILTTGKLLGTRTWIVDACYLLYISGSRFGTSSFWGLGVSGSGLDSLGSEFTRRGNGFAYLTCG